jgi:TRAP transporter TAXI family solute receptor
MSRFFGFVFAACLLAISTSTTVLAANPDWPKTLALATSSPGGVFYVYGETLAPFLTKRLGIDVNHLPTQGPVHNVKLIETGGAQFGIVTMGVALQGWNGTGDWTMGKQFRSMRALVPLYDSPLQMFALRRSSITTVADLDGKRVCVGPRAGTGGAYASHILSTLGISADLKYGSFDQMSMELLSSDCAAVVTVLGAPVPAFVTAETKEPMRFIALSSEQIDALRKAMPEFSLSRIAAGTYSSLEKDHVTVGIYNFLIGRADLPEDMVYKLVGSVHEAQPLLIKAHSSAREMRPENVDKNTFLPFHPGAVRYYREIGIKIPDALVPTN